MLVNKIIAIKLVYQLGYVYVTMGPLSSPLSRTRLVIPWIMIFNIIPWIFVVILDASLGDAFSDTGKASVCLIFFIVNIIYLLYVLLKYLSLMYKEITHFIGNVYVKEKEVIVNQQQQQQKRDKHDTIHIMSIIDLMVGNGFSWTWIFTSLYYFNNTFYISNIVNQP